MLFKFRSRAAADVIMLEADGSRILQIIGKDASPTGIVTVAQIPAAIAALEAAVSDEDARLRAAAQAGAAEEGDESDATAAARRESVHLHQRAAPFIDLLRRSAEEGHDVVWGV